MTADFIGHSLMSAGMRHQAEMTRAGDRRTPSQTPTDMTPIHGSWPHDTNLILVCKGAVSRPPVSTKTGNDQQGRPLLHDLQVLQKNSVNIFLTAPYTHCVRISFFFFIFLLSPNVALL